MARLTRTIEVGIGLNKMGTLITTTTVRIRHHELNVVVRPDRTTELPRVRAERNKRIARHSASTYVILA